MVEGAKCIVHLFLQILYLLLYRFAFVGVLDLIDFAFDVTVELPIEELLDRQVLLGSHQLFFFKLFTQEAKLIDDLSFVLSVLELFFLGFAQLIGSLLRKWRLSLLLPKPALLLFSLQGFVLPVEAISEVGFYFFQAAEDSSHLLLHLFGIEVFGCIFA